MRYLYDTYIKAHNYISGEATWRRVDTCTRLTEALRYTVGYTDGTWRIHVTDGLGKSGEFDIQSADDAEGWFETLQRKESWRSKEGKQRDADALKVLKDHPWEPFDEQETEIHMKEQVPAKTDKVYTFVTAGRPLADNNVKTAAAVGKPQMSAVPPTALFALGAAMQNGADKYGKFNWRGTAVTASVFYDAMLRHLTAWYAGEDHAQDSKVHHLGHLMAGCAIILDAEAHKVFNDDRDLKHVIVPSKGQWIKE